MKKISTLLTIFVFVLVCFKSTAQFTQNYEAGMASLTANCWSFGEINHTTDATLVITGTGSLYTNPPTNGSSTRDIITPYLNVISTSLTISFNYKLSNQINGNATRTIETGLLDVNGNFTSLNLIVMDRFSSAMVQSFNQTFTVPTGMKKVIIKLGGSTGDGNTRIIFDDLYCSASAKYGPSTNCNGAPVAVNDTFNGIIGNIVIGNVLTNDNEPDGETMSPAIVSTSPNGIVVMNNSGNFIFTPNPLFLGTTTSFTYHLTDNGYDPQTSNTATVTINLSALGTLPVK